jgi:D-alanyl-D-alanine carboxypeptidase
MLALLLADAALLVSCSTFSYKQKGAFVVSKSEGAMPGAALDAALAEALIADRASSIQVFALDSSGAYSALASHGEAPSGGFESIRFQIGSATKTFTAAIVLMARDRGLVSLDDAIGAWFPGAPGAKAITIRMLLKHRSGLADIFGDFGFLMASSLGPAKLWEAGDVIGRALRMKPKGAPGERFSYCNLGYILAGEIAAMELGKPIGELYEELIFGPLGMADSYLVAPGIAPKAGGARAGGVDDGYLPLGPHRIGADTASWPSLAGASGGCVSTARDLAVFYRALFGGELLSEASLAEMTNFDEVEGLPEDAMRGYGLGLSEMELPDGSRAWGHRGVIMGFDSTPLYFPETGAVIVALRNYSAMDDERGLSIAGKLHGIITGGR